MVEPITTASETLSEALVPGAKAGLGSVGKKALGPLAAVPFVATDLYKAAAENPVNPEAKQGEVVMNAAVGLGAGAATAALLGTGVVATGGTILVGIAAVAVADYTAGKIDQAMYGESDHMFQPTASQLNMRGLANGAFHDELADPKTGNIDFNDMNTLNKYSALLVNEIDRRENKVKEASSFMSYIPRWMRWGDGVVNEQSVSADLRIAKSAHTEVSQQMSIAVMQRNLQEVANAKIKKLIRHGGSELTLQDLDRDGDGKLTAKDAKKIREILGDDKLADSLFKSLKEKYHITFDGYVLPEKSIAQTADVAAPVNNVSPGASDVKTKTGNEPEILSGIWTAIVTMFNKIVSFFSGSSPQTTVPTGERPIQPSENLSEQTPINHGLPSQLQAQAGVALRKL